MAFSYDDSVYNFDLNILHQSGDDTALQTYNSKANKSVLRVKERIIATELVIKRYCDKKALLNETERKLQKFKDEYKETCLEYRDTIKKLIDLESEVQSLKLEIDTLNQANREFQQAYTQSEAIQEGLQSYIKQLQLLIKEHENTIEGLKIESKLSNNTDKHQTKDKEIAILKQEKNQLYKHVHIFAQLLTERKNLKKSDKALLKLYQKSEDTNNTDTDEDELESLCDDESLDHKSHKVNKIQCIEDISKQSKREEITIGYGGNSLEGYMSIKNQQILNKGKTSIKPTKNESLFDPDSDASNEVAYSIDTGCGSSVASSDNEKGFSSPEYTENNTILGLDSVLMEKNVTSIVGSPVTVCHSDVDKLANSNDNGYSSFDSSEGKRSTHLESIEKNRVLNLPTDKHVIKVVNVATSPIKISHSDICNKVSYNVNSRRNSSNATSDNEAGSPDYKNINKISNTSKKNVMTNTATSPVKVSRVIDIATSPIKISDGRKTIATQFNYTLEIGSSDYKHINNISNITNKKNVSKLTNTATSPMKVSRVIDIATSPIKIPNGSKTIATQFNYTLKKRNKADNQQTPTITIDEDAEVSNILAAMKLGFDRLSPIASPVLCVRPQRRSPQKQEKNALLNSQVNTMKKSIMAITHALKSHGITIPIEVDNTKDLYNFNNNFTRRETSSNLPKDKLNENKKIARTVKKQHILRQSRRLSEKRLSGNYSKTENRNGCQKRCSIELTEVSSSKSKRMLRSSDHLAKQRQKLSGDSIRNAENYQPIVKLIDHLAKQQHKDVNVHVKKDTTDKVLDHLPKQQPKNLSDSIQNIGKDIPADKMTSDKLNQQQRQNNVKNCITTVENNKPLDNMTIHDQSNKTGCSTTDNMNRSDSIVSYNDLDMFISNDSTNVNGQKRQCVKPTEISSNACKKKMRSSDHLAKQQPNHVSEYVPNDKPRDKITHDESNKIRCSQINNNREDTIITYNDLDMFSGNDCTNVESQKGQSAETTEVSSGTCKRTLRSSNHLAKHSKNHGNDYLQNAENGNHIDKIIIDDKINKTVDSSIDCNRAINYNDLDMFNSSSTGTNIDVELIPQHECEQNKKIQKGFFCRMLEKYAKKNITRKQPLSEKCIESIYENLEQNIGEIIDLPNKEANDAMKSFAESLQNENEKCFVSALITFLRSPKRKEDIVCKINIQSAPSMSKSEQVLLYIVNHLKSHWDKVDIYDMVLKSIEYTLFKLGVTPNFEEVESLSHFYAVLCRYTRAKSRLRLFMLDAMYCLAYKAVPVIKQCLDVWMHILPLANLRLAQCPLVLSLVYLLHFYRCEDFTGRVQNIRCILYKRYSYQMSDWNEMKIFDLLKETLINLREIPIEKKMVRLSLILIAKRHGVDWCQKNIVKKLLLPIIENKSIAERIRCFCVSVLGAVLRPYPKNMKVHCEIVLNQLFVMLDENPSPQMQEAVFNSLLYLSKHNNARVLDALVSWRPERVSPVLEELIKDFIHEKTAKTLIYMLSQSSQ